MSVEQTIHPLKDMLVEKFSLNIERDDTGLWYATSTEIKGLFLAGPTLPDLLHEVPWVINELEQSRKRFSSQIGIEQ